MLRGETVSAKRCALAVCAGKTVLKPKGVEIASVKRDARSGAKKGVRIGARAARASSLGFLCLKSGLNLVFSGPTPCQKTLGEGLFVHCF